MKRSEATATRVAQRTHRLVSVEPARHESRRALALCGRRTRTEHVVLSASTALITCGMCLRLTQRGQHDRRV